MRIWSSSGRGTSGWRGRKARASSPSPCAPRSAEDSKADEQQRRRIHVRADGDLPLDLEQRHDELGGGGDASESQMSKEEDSRFRDHGGTAPIHRVARAAAAILEIARSVL